MRARPFVTTVALTLGLVSLPAFAGVVKIVGATSSSIYPEGDGVRYTPEQSYDHKVSANWTEGDESGSGLGEWVQVDFDGETNLTAFRIWNGTFTSYDMWNRSNRIKDLEIEFSDGSKQTFTLTDEMKSEYIELKPVKASWAKLRIKSVYSGTTFTDTAVSEVVFYDDADSGEATVKSWKASSVYAADADGNYEPTNMQDTAVDTMWCEGDKAGDGVGEWVEATFDAPTQISSLKLVNGNGYNIMYAMKGNLATELTLTFSDGSTQTVAVKPSGIPQSVSFQPVTTSSVKVQVNTIRKGKEFNDLCFSELHFVK
ncbi:MAG: hypothetical protein VX899_26095 [Myxococcota bacterium]|nr:hypothetical protein [Myxococcota bacterium]